MQRIGKQIALTVSEEMDERMREIGKKQNVSKAEAYRKMANLGLEVYGDFEKSGVILFADLAIKAKEMLKFWQGKKQPRLF